MFQKAIKSEIFADLTLHSGGKENRTMKRIIFISCVLAIFLLVLLSSRVMAQGGKIRVGNLKIVPSLGLEAELDDNIYLGNGSNNTSELKESDWITHVKPGLSFEYTMEGRGSISAGYEGDFAYYDKNDRNDWKSHKGLFTLDYEAPGGLIAIIDNTYNDTQDPFGGYAEYGIGQKTERWTNDLKNEFGYKVGSRLKVFLYYNYYIQDYKDDVNVQVDAFVEEETGKYEAYSENAFVQFEDFADEMREYGDVRAEWEKDRQEAIGAAEAILSMIYDD